MEAPVNQEPTSKISGEQALGVLNQRIKAAEETQKMSGPTHPISLALEIGNDPTLRRFFQESRFFNDNPYPPNLMLESNGKKARFDVREDPMTKELKMTVLFDLDNPWRYDISDIKKLLGKSDLPSGNPSPRGDQQARETLREFGNLSPKESLKKIGKMFKDQINPKVGSPRMV